MATSHLKGNYTDIDIPTVIAMSFSPVVREDTDSMLLRHSFRLSNILIQIREYRSSFYISSIYIKI